MENDNRKVLYDGQLYDELYKLSECWSLVIYWITWCCLPILVDYIPSIVFIHSLDFNSLKPEISIKKKFVPKNQNVWVRGILHCYLSQPIGREKSL